MIPDATVLRRLAAVLSRPGELAGSLVGWLVPALVLLIGYDVAMRYLFNAGSVMLQELEWHLFAAIFLLGAAHTLNRDEHVRVDILYRSERLGARGRALVDVVGCILFLLPYCFLVIVYSWDFALAAFQAGEGSPDPGGLPARWVIKGVLPLGFVLLALEGLALLARRLAVLVETR